MKREYFKRWNLGETGILWHVSVGETGTHTYSKEQVIREQVVCTAGLWITLLKNKTNPKEKTSC